MPCCIATLQYLGCKHCNLFKLCCTTRSCNAQSLCPPQFQHVLVSAKYKWSCRGCVDDHFALDDDDRFESWGAQYRQIDQDASVTEEMRMIKRETLEEKQHFWESRLTARRERQMLELELIESWVRTYAWAVLEMLYGRRQQQQFADAAFEHDPMEGVEEERSGEDRNGHENESAEQTQAVPEPGLVEASPSLSSLIEMRHPDVISVRDASRTAQWLRASVGLESQAVPSPTSLAAPQPAIMPTGSREPNVGNPRL
ncbi:hypothetical protein VFPPC_17943 [Pochonia chlamydosporia 170]|uniref:Uncharacterized protein n=1 Tax=Pochonia chlamydosporia 170 TaxID=1380566 RepID=A0A219ARB5_METCM|nr:hypothetical protein VFPPC_17943 [Pochonia chlamydosporia 170]OWT42864.1 hypothetical protein VFPPC_17943 [Pochonia chlamydosporia 170]